MSDKTPSQPPPSNKKQKRSTVEETALPLFRGFSERGELEGGEGGSTGPLLSARQAFATGSHIVNVEPTPTSVATVKRPPNFSTISRLMAKPTPVPGVL